MKKVKRLTGNRKHEKYSLFTYEPYENSHGKYLFVMYRKSLLRELVKIEK